MKNINTNNFFHATNFILNINMTSLDTCFLNLKTNNNTNYHIYKINIKIRNEKHFRNIYERQFIVKIMKIDK